MLKIVRDVNFSNSYWQQLAPLARSCRSGRRGSESLDERLNGTTCGNLAAELSAHVPGVQLPAHAAEIKPVSVPTGANGRVFTKVYRMRATCRRSGEAPGRRR